MFISRSYFLRDGFVFSVFGDDVMIGIWLSVLNDVVLKDGELTLDPDIDGMDESDILFINNGMVYLGRYVCCHLHLEWKTLFS